MVKKSENDPLVIPQISTCLDSQDKTIQIIEASQRILERIQQSPALNGGFEKLTYTVDVIKSSQDQLTEKVDSIHEALYEPDLGLYARVKEAAKAESVAKVAADVQDLKSWRTNEEKSAVIEVNSEQEADQFIKEHAELMIFKRRTLGVAKWVVLSIGSGLLTLLGKIIYDVIIGHIKFI